MEEILALQQQLAEVQKGSTSQKLSDRNCVELVMKLQQLKLIDLVFTRSGKEYLTHEQLSIEIEDEILARGGRVNIIDLPDALDVDLAHIQTKIPSIVESSDGCTRLVRGEVITDYYLQSVAEEINDTLTSSEHGIDNIGAIASRYALPVDIVRDTVSTHQQSIINACLDAQNPDILRSQASIERNHAAARGLLRAVTAPTTLSEVAKVRQLPLALVATLVEEMLEQGSLSGSRIGRGARAVFVPTVYANAAAEAAVSAFQANGFITLGRLSKMYIQDSDSFIAQHLSDGVALGECVVGPILLDTLETSTEEAVSGGSWIDVEVALPPDFPQGDIQAVLLRLVNYVGGHGNSASVNEPSEIGKSSRSRRRGKAELKTATKGDSEESSVVYGNRFIVSPKFVNALKDALSIEATQRAEERAKMMTEKMGATVIISSEGAKEEDKQEIPSAEGGKKGKGKGRRRAGGKDKSNKSSDANGSSNAAGNTDDFPIYKPTVEEAIELIMGDEQWSAAIETDYLGSSNAGDDMLYSIMEEVYGEDGLSSLYQSKAEEAVVSLMRERALAKKNAEKAILAGLEEAELYYKAANTLPSEDLVQSSQSHVLGTFCISTLSGTVDVVAQSTGIVDGRLAKIHELPTRKEKLEVLRDVVSKLAPTLEAKLRQFINVVSEKDGGTVEEFLTLYDDNVSLFDLPERRPLDKKGEKARFANARANTTLSFEEEELQKMECVRLAATLVHAKSCGGSIVVIPMEEVNEFCSAIEAIAKPAEVGIALKELREAAIEESEDDTAYSEKLAAFRELIG